MMTNTRSHAPRPVEVPPDIFLSYAKEDREVARRMALLFELVGWRVWWDRRIPAGTNWQSVLESALTSMRCMIVLWSKHSVNSEWVKQEADEGRERSILVPVLIEPVMPPRVFRSVQTADLSEWDGSPHAMAFRQLVLDLESMLGKPEPLLPGALEERYLEVVGTTTHDEQPDAPLTPARRNRWANKQSLWLVILIMAVATVAGAAFATRGWWTMTREHAVAPPAAMSYAPSEATPANPLSSPIPEQTSAFPEQPPVPRPESERKMAAPPSVETPRRSPNSARPSEQGASGPAPAASPRCSDILRRLQLGETPSAEELRILQSECRR